MILSASGLAAIERREGTRLTAYRDTAGLWTIGCGHLLTKSDLSSGKLLGEDWRDGISQAVCDQQLRADLELAVNAVNNFVHVALLQHQFDALVSFVFNVG